MSFFTSSIIHIYQDKPLFFFHYNIFIDYSYVFCECISTPKCLYSIWSPDGDKVRNALVLHLLGWRCIWCPLHKGTMECEPSTLFHFHAYPTSWPPHTLFRPLSHYNLHFELNIATECKLVMGSCIMNTVARNQGGIIWSSSHMPLPSDNSQRSRICQSQQAKMC